LPAGYRPLALWQLADLVRLYGYDYLGARGHITNRAAPQGRRNNLPVMRAHPAKYGAGQAFARRRARPATIGSRLTCQGVRAREVAADCWRFRARRVGSGSLGCGGSGLGRDNAGLRAALEAEVGGQRHESRPRLEATRQFRQELGDPRMLEAPGREGGGGPLVWRFRPIFVS